MNVRCDANCKMRYGDGVLCFVLSTVSVAVGMEEERWADEEEEEEDDDEAVVVEGDLYLSEEGGGPDLNKSICPACGPNVNIVVSYTRLNTCRERKMLPYSD